VAKNQISITQRESISKNIEGLEKRLLRALQELEDKGVTAIMLFSDDIAFTTMAKSSHWEFVYFDTKCMLFVNNSSPTNSSLLTILKNNELVYPSATAKNKSLELQSVFGKLREKQF
jgi:hypothetical protein